MSLSDEDFRFMGTLDLMNDLREKSFRLDDDDEHRIVRAVLKLLEDTNDEVQNQAVKCLISLTGKLKEQNVKMICDQLSSAGPFYNTEHTFYQLRKQFIKSLN